MPSPSILKVWKTPTAPEGEVVANRRIVTILGRIFAPDTKGSANMYPRARNFFIIRLLSQEFV
jgi:hypothetical protein